MSLVDLIDDEGNVVVEAREVERRIEEQAREIEEEWLEWEESLSELFWDEYALA